jgi:hypothetical protein
MSNRIVRHACLGLGLLALAACVGIATRPGRRVSASQVQPPSFASVTVWGLTDLDPQTQALYQNLANAIAGFTGAPDARAAYYSYYNDGVNWAIGSWSASVVDAAPDGNGGYNVTLPVGPIFTTTPQTANGVCGGYQEIFNVDANGGVTYVGWQDTVGGMVGSRLGEIAY